MNMLVRTYSLLLKIRYTIHLIVGYSEFYARALCDLKTFSYSAQVTIICICSRPGDASDCALTWPTLMVTLALPSTTSSLWVLPRQSTDSILSEITREMQVSISCMLLLILLDNNCVRWIIGNQ